MEKCCTVRPSCFVAFQPLGSLCSSLPKQLSPLELNNKGMDVNLEHLDDFSIFGSDIDDDVLDHGNTGKDDDFNDDARTQTATQTTMTQMAGDKHLLYDFDWEGSDGELDVGSNPVGGNSVVSSFCKYLTFSCIIVWTLCCNCI
jgi:hypothetical protein